MTSNGAQIVMGKSDSGLHIALHPLVLLTISDYITRHTLKQQSNPIVGALLGQQNGRETTVEHAFECKVGWSDAARAELDLAWFEIRLQQMKDVHKAPALDLVGWWTTMPPEGPQQHHMPIQKSFTDFYPECSLLLAFHPSEVLDGPTGGKLPLEIYETTSEPLKSGGDQDVIMQGGESPDVKVTYKQVPYTIETGEAEMISVDFVAKGGGNATAIKQSAPARGKVAAAAGTVGDVQADEDTSTTTKSEESPLSQEDEETISALNAKVNAIKMLRSRINLLKQYLQNLPPSFTSNTQDDSSQEYSPIDNSILRSIQALLNRLALLIPTNSTAFAQDLLKEQNDVALVNLLSSLTQNIKSANEVGKKFAYVDGVQNAGGNGRKAQNGDASSSNSQGNGFNRAGDLLGT